jgi:hypothetical protein
MRQSLLISLILSSASAFAPTHTQSHRSNVVQMNAENDIGGRREMFSKILGGAALIASASQPVIANALDMDAFMNKELENDTKNCDPKRDPKCIPKLNSDEALCKYGQGKAHVEACRRLKAAGVVVEESKAPVKSLGGAYAM